MCLMEGGVGALIWFYTSPSGPEEVLTVTIVTFIPFAVREAPPPENCCRLEAATSGSEWAEVMPPQGRLAGLGFPAWCRSDHTTGCYARNGVFLLPRLPEPSPSAREGGCLGRQVGAPHPPELRVQLFSQKWVLSKQALAAVWGKQRWGFK